MTISNADWSRIGDTSFGIGMERFRNSYDRALWRFSVTGNSSKQKLIDMDASVSDLRDIIRYCQRAIETLETDGGRNVEAEEAA